MAVSNIMAVFPCGAEKVWSVVTDLKDWSWRSDLSRIEILSEKEFVEYTKDGFAAKFTVTVCEPPKLWEFDMENSNMSGRWRGVFSERDGETTVDFTEDVTPKKLFMKPLVGGYLKKQQSAYIKDLESALKNR